MEMQQNAETITAPQALLLILAGGHARRCGWPLGTYLFAMRVESPLTLPHRWASFSVSGANQYEQKTLRIQPTVYRVEGEACFPWVPSQADLFARDWVEVDA